MAIDLTTKFCGLTFRNPIIVPAGVHGRDGDTIRAVSESGVAGICTKTIVSQPAPDVLPCFTTAKAGMLNAVFGSDRPSEYWFGEGIKRAKEGSALVIANLAGFSPEEAAGLASKAVAAGADMIEIPTHCPHMGEILMAMFPGLSMPEPALTDLDPMKRTVKAVKQAVKVPVVVKLSGTFSHITKEWARGVKEAGADGIGCSDALGPALRIDIRTGQPALGGPRGVGGLTGPAIMPITLRMVLDIATSVDLPIVGVGGVGSASDVVEYIMAGATLVGVCTAGHMNGTTRYTKIIRDLETLLGELGASSPADLRGLALRRIRERREKGWVAVTAPKVPVVDEPACTGCGTCEKVCAYGAMRVEEKARVDEPSRCIGCGLCASACPASAIELEYYPA
ncbi:MAG TPA: 4Fe-4S dicluster domain-containing protein [Spirochaetia bacterium]